MNLVQGADPLDLREMAKSPVQEADPRGQTDTLLRHSSCDYLRLSRYSSGINVAPARRDEGQMFSNEVEQA